jgi:hypothetical protein
VAEGATEGWRLWSWRAGLVVLEGRGRIQYFAQDSGEIHYRIPGRTFFVTSTNVRALQRV